VSGARSGAGSSGPPVLAVGAGALDAAARALAGGGVVGVPTDTVYGLAVDPWLAGSTDRLFAVKDRPREVVVPVLVADEAQAGRLASELSPLALRLMRRWWPGALTVVVPARADLAADLGGDGRSVGIRCPDHAFLRELCERVGPLATTSANRHGEAPLHTAASVAASLPGLCLVVDGGHCDRPPSSVVSVLDGGLRVLREGAISARSLEESLLA